jgi:hypothetical protein
MKTVILFVLQCSVLTSCCQTKCSDQYKVSINDELVADAIRKYVVENRIDITKKVITIKAEVGIRRVFTITNDFSELYRTYFPPTYFGVLDGDKVFFLFTDVEKTFGRNNELIVKAIDELLDKYEVTLSKDTHLTYSAPVWRIVEQCDGTYRLNRNVTPFEFENLPCGYSIVRDSVKLDSIVLIKK